MRDQLHLGPTPARAGHARHDGDHPDYVYVGRGSIWGNPFVARGTAGRSRFRVVEVDDPLAEYERHVRSSAVLMGRLRELRGRVLGCYCVRLGQRTRAERCHAQVLARLVNEEEQP